jgi:hypothetical protein
MPHDLDAGLTHGERTSGDTFPGRTLRLLVVAAAAFGLAWSAAAESRPGGVPSTAPAAERLEHSVPGRLSDGLSAVAPIPARSVAASAPGPGPSAVTAPTTTSPSSVAPQLASSPTPAPAAAPVPTAAPAPTPAPLPAPSPPAPTSGGNNFDDSG